MSKGSRQQTLLHRFFYRENVKPAVTVQGPGHNQHKDSALAWLHDCCAATPNWCLLLAQSRFCFDPWGSIQASWGGQSLPPPSQTVPLSHCVLPYKYISVLQWRFLPGFVCSQNVLVHKQMSLFLGGRFLGSDKATCKWLSHLSAPE